MVLVDYPPITNRVGLTNGSYTQISDALKLSCHSPLPPYTLALSNPSSLIFFSQMVVPDPVPNISIVSSPSPLPFRNPSNDLQPAFPDSNAVPQRRKEGDRGGGKEGGPQGGCWGGGGRGGRECQGEGGRGAKRRANSVKIDVEDHMRWNLRSRCALSLTVV